jgi:hypothetical protein
VIIVLAQDEGCALIAEEFEAGRYRGFFTTNQNIANGCLGVSYYEFKWIFDTMMP